LVGNPAIAVIGRENIEDRTAAESRVGRVLDVLLLGEKSAEMKERTFRGSDSASSGI
jgi:hypothetical protein